MAASGSGDLKRTGGFDIDSSTVSKFCYEQHLRHIWTTNHASTFKMPWELTLNTPWDACKKLRTSSFDLHGPLPPVPVSANVCNSDEGADEILSFKQIGVKAVKNADSRLWADKLSWERKCAYKKWVGIILRQVSAFDIARQQVTCHTMEFARGGLLESVKDSLGMKASATLHSRAGPILQYIQFCEDRGIQAFPLVEPIVYDYVKSCESKAATYARSFLLALSFTNFHFGLTGTLSIMSSGRIKGLVNTMYAKKRKLMQRPPLTVVQIIHLEDIVLNSHKTEYDRVAAGFFLFVLMGRLRFSDGQQICQLQLDQQPDGFGFVEAVAAKTKTSVSLERKTRHLPVAVPLIPFGDQQWLPAWLELRKKIFGNLANSKDDFIPLLPAPAANGSWSKMPLSVTSGANWLRSLLHDTLDPRGTPVGTHSLKASLLSMAAKYGLPHSQRKLLGYHAGSKEQSMLCYSRDSMAEPLRQMCEMIRAVKNKAFLPDCSRSGRFPLKEPGEEVIEGDELSESSSSGSENEEETHHESEESACEKLLCQWQPATVEPMEEKVFVRHRISRCIHALADEAGLEFVCGRRMSQSYDVLEPKPSFCHPVCQTCFRDRAT